jgi:hypothetical protein
VSTPAVPVTDPTALYRLRDGIYAADLLIVAVAELDVFTFVKELGTVDAGWLGERLELDARAADVMVTYLVALGLLDREADGRLGISQMAAEHLVAGSPLDLRAYFASLRERPGCGELLAVLKTGEPAAWASASAQHDWTERLGEVGFAKRITAAMHARGLFLGPALARALADIPVRSVLDVGGQLRRLRVRACRSSAGPTRDRVRAPAGRLRGTNAPRRARLFRSHRGQLG